MFSRLKHVWKILKPSPCDTLTIEAPTEQHFRLFVLETVQECLMGPIEEIHPYCISCHKEHVYPSKYDLLWAISPVHGEGLHIEMHDMFWDLFGELS